MRIIFSTLLLSLFIAVSYAQMDGINCWDLNANGVGDLPAEDLNLDGNVDVLDCAGADGINCWDLNANGIADLPDEDLNQDGSVDVLDCVGTPGEDGADGISCWDLNQNGVADLPDEDVNQDGSVDVLDCVGTPGEDGAGGISCWDLNQNGVADLPDEDVNQDGSVDVLDCVGTPGEDGVGGISCWDLNQNGIADLPEEDVNQDGSVDVLDCVGTPGEDGAGGISCWDLNQNGVADLPDEDVNQDGSVDVLDCVGTPGEDGAGGISCWDLNQNGVADLPDEDVNQDGSVDVLDCVGTPGEDGAGGISCWDLNQNGVADLPDEDVNQDGSVDVLDCVGTPGQDGVDGENGQAGQDGTDGISCWDLNANGIGDLPIEDLNLDGNVDVLDCAGTPGEDGAEGVNGMDGQNGLDGQDGVDGQSGLDGQNGISCWDLNENGIGDLATEDLNLDGSVNVLDCSGNGSPNLPDDFFYNAAGDSIVVLIDGLEYILPVEPCPTDCVYSEVESDLCQVFFIKTSVDCNGVEWVDTLGCKPLLDCNLGEITVEKKFSQTDVLLGDTITAIIPYCNSGGQALTDIVVTDVIGPEFNLLTVNPSEGSWNATNHELTWGGPLDPGQCESIIFELEVLSGEGLTHNIVTASADNGNGTKSTSASDNDFVIIEDPFIDPIARVTGGSLTIIGTDTDGDGVDDEFTITGMTELTPEFVKEDGTTITSNEYYSATLTNICTNTLVDSWTGTLGTTDYVSDGVGATDATDDLTGPIAHNTPFDLDKRRVAIDANMTGEGAYGVWEICFTVGGGTSTCPTQSTNTDNCTLIERILTTGGDNQAFPVDLISNSPPDDPRFYQNYTEPFQANNPIVNPFLDTLGSILQIPECAIRNFSASGLSYFGIQYSGVNQVAYIRELQMTDASVIDGRTLPGADPIWGLAMGTGANAGTVNQLQYYDELFDYTALALNDPNIYLTESEISSGAALSSRVGTYALSSNLNTDCSSSPRTIDATILEYQAPSCTGVNAPFADTQIILNWNILKSETY